MVEENILDEFNDFDELCVLEQANTLEYIYNIISYPILFAHESLHLLFGYLVGLTIEDSFVSSPRLKNMHGSVYFKEGIAKSKTRELFVSLSPILLLLIPVVLVIYNLLFLPLLVWVLISIPFAIPSKIDFSRFFLYEKFKYAIKHDTTTELIENINNKSFIELFFKK